MRLLLAALLVIVQAACVYGDPATPPRNDEATPSPALRSAQPLPSPARAPVDPGSDEGTIELVSADSARYTASNGLVIELTRSADRERRGVLCA